MNKKFRTLLICLLSCLMLTCFIACNAKDEEPTVTSIAMASTPKTEYYIGDTFDITGAKITVTYSDATTETVDVTIEMVTAPDLTTIGDKTVTVTYSEKTTTYQISVSKTDAMLLAEAKTAALTALDDAFAQYNEADYLETKWSALEKYYTDAKTAIESATTIGDVTVAKNVALTGMAEVLTEEAQIANFNSLVSGAVTKISTYDERSYLPADLETLKSKISTHKATIEAITFTGDDDADAAAIQAALDTAIVDIATVKVTYLYIDEGAWTDSNGAALTEVTENLPDGISSAYLLTYDGNAASFVSIFSPTNGIDTTDLVENCGNGSKPTVVFTFWLYVEDASKLIGTNNAVANGDWTDNGAGVNVYMGTQKVDSSVGRAFYLDGKWYKTSTIASLVSGWNKISLGTGTSGTEGAVAENIVFTMYDGADSDLNVKMMIADLRVHYLDEAQNGRAAVTEKIADISSVAVKALPTSTALDLNATEYNPAGGVITVNYADGTTQDVDITAEMLTLPDTSTKGYKNVTVSYTVRGITKTTEFEVAVGITLEDIKQESLTALKAAYESYGEANYLTGTWAILKGYYDTAKAEIEGATDAIAVKNAKDTAIAAMAALKNETDYTAMFEGLQEAAIAKLVLPAGRQYTNDNRTAANGILTTAIGEVESLTATGNETTDNAAIDTIVNTALSELASIASWINLTEGTWSGLDGTGNKTYTDLTSTTENLPAELSGKTAYVLNNAVENFAGATTKNAMFTANSDALIDTTDLLAYSQAGGSSKPTVVFTFWLYIDNVDNFKGTTGQAGNAYGSDAAALNVYVGDASNGIPGTRGFFLDGKWYKAVTYNGLVSGWNKISVGTGAANASNVAGEYKYLNILLCEGAGTDLANTTIMIADLRIEYLEVAQSNRLAVTDKIGNLSSISVSTLPSNTMIVAGTSEWAPENGKLTVTYADGNNEEIDLTAAMCTVPDLSEGGTKQVTVTYTVRGITKTTTFDISVVGVAEARTAALAEIEAAYAACIQANYNTAKWQTITDFYNNGKTAVNAATSVDEVNTAKATAVNGINSVSISYVYLNGTWSGFDSNGEYVALSSTTENLPEELTGKTAYVLNNATKTFASATTKNAMFTANTDALIDTTDLLEYSQAGGKDKPTVVFTFWLYIGNVDNFKGTTGEAGNAIGTNAATLNAYVGDASNGIPSTRGFYLDGKWFKSVTYNGLVSGWNKISMGTGAASTSNVAGEYKYLNILLCEGEGTDLANTTIMIADLRIEYLDTAQSSRLAVTETIADAAPAVVNNLSLDAVLPGKEEE